MLRYTLVVSDVHLSTLVRAPGTWMPYRRAEHLTDSELARVFDTAAVVARSNRAPLEIVLNGDLFDLDAPSAEGTPHVDRMHRTEAGAAWVMRQVLSDHGRVVDALGRALAGGARVVVIAGNHDAQLTFPAVRAELAMALADAARRAGSLLPPDVAFRAWMHVTPDRILVEHGHQYDPICAMASLGPRGRGGERGGELDETVGSVVSHYLPLLLSHVNPYSSDPVSALPTGKLRILAACMEDGPARAPEWGRAFVLFLRELLTAAPAPQGADDAAVALAALETGASPDVLREHRALWAPQADASYLFGAATRLSSYARDLGSRLETGMRASAALHEARAVVTGHTHSPFVIDVARSGEERLPPRFSPAPQARSLVLANSGSWTSLAGQGADRSRPLGSFVWALTDGPHTALKLRHVWPSGVVT